MYRLWLLRHAKSRWDQAGLSDHQRGLSLRGQDAIALMAQRHAQRLQGVQAIYSSDATRARLSAEVMAEHLAGASVELTSDLYCFDAGSVERFIAQLPQTQHEVLLVGHNPAFEDLLLANGAKLDKFPTASLACIEFSQSWSQAEGAGRVVFFNRPKANHSGNLLNS